MWKTQTAAICATGIIITTIGMIATTRTTIAITEMTAASSRSYPTIRGIGSVADRMGRETVTATAQIIGARAAFLANPSLMSMPMSMPNC